MQELEIKALVKLVKRYRVTSVLIVSSIMRAIAESAFITPQLVKGNMLPFRSRCTISFSIAPGIIGRLLAKTSMVSFETGICAVKNKAQGYVNGNTERPHEIWGHKG
ncbi:Calcium-transporting ATPase [Psidium guajava]|nr:Calcium-transporting ATPase [Psidium guajava]